MNIFKNKLLKSLGTYTLLNLINSAIPFLLLPVLTKYLSPSDYGIVDMFNNFNFILLPILGLNLGSSIIRFYFIDNVDFQKIVNVVVTYILVFGIISFLIIGGIYIIDFNIFKGNIPQVIIVYTVIYVVFSQLVDVLLNIWRAEEKALYYGILRILKTLLDLSLSLYCLIILNLGWKGRVYPILIITILLGVLSLFIISRKFKFKVDLDLNSLKKILTFTLPLIFHSLGGYLIGFSDRFIILYYLDVKEVGIYSVAYQIGMIMSFVNNSFNQAYAPYLFLKLKEKNLSSLSLLKKINKYYFLLMIVLAITIYIFVPLIYKNLINEKFYVSSKIVLWVLLGYAFNGMYKIVVNYLFYYRKTKSIAYITVFSALINIVFCVLLVPQLGILGASVSTTIAFATMFLLVYVKYKKLDLHEKVN